MVWGVDFGVQGSILGSILGPKVSFDVIWDLKCHLKTLKCHFLPVLVILVISGIWVKTWNPVSGGSICTRRSYGWCLGFGPGVTFGQNPLLTHFECFGHISEVQKSLFGHIWDLGVPGRGRSLGWVPCDPQHRVSVWHLLRGPDTQIGVFHVLGQMSLLAIFEVWGSLLTSFYTPWDPLLAMQMCIKTPPKPVLGVLLTPPDPSWTPPSWPLWTPLTGFHSAWSLGPESWSWEVSWGGPFWAQKWVLDLIFDVWESFLRSKSGFWGHFGSQLPGTLCSIPPYWVGTISVSLVILCHSVSFWV